MKKFAFGIAIALLASSAFAGTLIDPVVEPDVIIEQAASSSADHGIIVPILFLVLMGVSLFL